MTIASSVITYSSYKATYVVVTIIYKLKYIK
jgi:hypothetical protein